MAGIATYHTFGRVHDPEKEFEETYVLKVKTDHSTKKDTFSLVLATDSESIQVFSGMGIDNEGRLFSEKNKNKRVIGVWWPTGRKKSDFSIKGAYKIWKRARRVGFEGAKRFKLSDKYNLPVVAGYDRGMIRFKGKDGDLSFRVEFTFLGQRERFEKRWSNSR